MTQRATVIVLGNEKGGTGKSTVAMHLIAALLSKGRAVGSIDLDARQGTLSRYVENRAAFAGKRGVALMLPDHQAISRCEDDDQAAARHNEAMRFNACFERLASTCDFVVIDTPGGDSFLSAEGHSRADILITPLNDSFLDLDVLALVNWESLEIVRPSHYSAMVWDRKKERARRDRVSMDWIVLRNRLSNLDAHNKRNMADVLEKLGMRIGFRAIPGFGERVIFRELFLKGLTLLDLRQDETGVELTMSHVTARQELRALLGAIGLDRPGLGEAAE